MLEQACSSFEGARVLHALCTKRRSGWLKRGIPSDHAETVYQHSRKCRTAATLFFGYVLKSPRDQILLFADQAEIHDFPEWDAPDYVPREVTEAVKYAAEYAALKRGTALVQPHGEYIERLWLSFENDDSFAVRALHDIDKLDAMVQAIEYERQGYCVQDFYEYTSAVLRVPFFKRICAEMLSLRPEILKTRGGGAAYREYFQLIRSSSL